MAATTLPNLPKQSTAKLKGKTRNEQARAEEEFLDMAMEHLKAMPAEQYKNVSEQLEIIGNAARASA